MAKEYITGIQALNYHNYDWHKTAFKDFEHSVYDNWKELKETFDFGITDNIASPVRAFIDYVYNTVKFEHTVPAYRINMFLFDENEEKEILTFINKHLKEKLNREEQKLLEKWINYNNGGKYEFDNKQTAERKAKRRAKKTYRKND